MIHVEVTQEDIEQASRASASTCPIARAVKRATGANRVTVYDAILIDGEDFEKYHTPPEAFEWLKRYDDGHKVEPISFTLKDQY